MKLEWNPDDGMVIALTGAGISADSGIPTFRGQEGYWTVGSEVYRPQEMATNRAYQLMRDDVWQWYLYRRTVCRAAEPNAAHRALARLEEHAGDRFRLITQNVDGLHIRAGNTMERTYQIHGNIDYMRCDRECGVGLIPVPDDVGEVRAGDEFTDRHRELLQCRACKAPARPHVLWFDECYDEARYKFESSLRAATECSFLLIVGSTASTNLPVQVAQLAARAGATVIDVNIEGNPFGDLAKMTDGGGVARGRASDEVPRIVDALIG